MNDGLPLALHHARESRPVGGWTSAARSSTSSTWRGSARVAETGASKERRVAPTPPPPTPRTLRTRGRARGVASRRRRCHFGAPLTRPAATRTVMVAKGGGDGGERRVREGVARRGRRRRVSTEASAKERDAREEAERVAKETRAKRARLGAAGRQLEALGEEVDVLRARLSARGRARTRRRRRGGDHRDASSTIGRVDGGCRRRRRARSQTRRRAARNAQRRAGLERRRRRRRWPSTMLAANALAASTKTRLEGLAMPAEEARRIVEGGDRRGDARVSTRGARRRPRKSQSTHRSRVQIRGWPRRVSANRWRRRRERRRRRRRRETPPGATARRNRARRSPRRRQVGRCRPRCRFRAKAATDVLVRTRGARGGDPISRVDVGDAFDPAKPRRRVADADERVRSRREVRWPPRRRILRAAGADGRGWRERIRRERRRASPSLRASVEAAEAAARADARQVAAVEEGRRVVMPPSPPRPAPSCRRRARDAGGGGRRRRRRLRGDATRLKSERDSRTSRPPSRTRRSRRAGRGRQQDARGGPPSGDARRGGGDAQRRRSGMRIDASRA